MGEGELIFPNGFREDDTDEVMTINDTM